MEEIKEEKLDKVSGGTHVYSKSGKFLYDRGMREHGGDHRNCPKCDSYQLVQTETGLICKQCGLRRDLW